jgi:phosphohistidine phosphatase
MLNKRGQASAKAVGAWMASNGYIPDMVLCSDAARTRETADLILLELPAKPELQLSQMLYHAAPDTILDQLHRQEARTIAVIGHNPGIGMLANALVSTAPDHHQFGDYPTCATTVIEFDTNRWVEITPRTGRATAFVVPRDLIEDADFHRKSTNKSS